VLSDHHGARRAIALTEANIGASLGGSVAAVALGVGQQSGLGWRAALLLALALPAAAACAFHALALEVPRPLVHRAAPRPPALPGLFWVYWSIILLLGAAEWCVTYWGAEYLHRPVGFERSVAAALMSAFLLAMVAGRVLGSRLVRVVASPPLLVGAIAGALGGFVLFWLAPVPLVAVGGLAVTGLGVANLYPLGLASAVAVAARQSERASARITLSSGLALLLAPLTVGGLADRVGLRAAYSVVPVLLVVALISTLLALRHTHRQPHVA
jgi:predicted MFS family arabinose efflux permease